MLFRSHLLTADHPHQPDETIEALVRHRVATVTPDTALEALMSIFTTRRVAVVVEEQQPVGILTKIDLLDFMAGAAKLP